MEFFGGSAVKIFGILLIEHFSHNKVERDVMGGTEYEGVLSGKDYPIISRQNPRIRVINLSVNRCLSIRRSNNPDTVHLMNYSSMFLLSKL